MKQCITFFFVLLYSFGFCQEVLSPEQLQEDFDQFKEQLYKRNKGLHLFVSEEEYAAHLDSIEQELATEKTNLEFYELLNKAIIPVQERHLSVNGFHKKSEFARQMGDKGDVNRKIFPLYVYFENDSTAHVLRNAWRDSTIVLPSRLLRINGKSVAEIRQQIAQYITQDFGITTWKNWEISRTFPIKYHFTVDTTSSFVIEWQGTDGSIQQSELKGIKRKAYSDSLKRQSKEIYDIEKFRAPLRYELFDSLKIGYLRINSFSNKKVKHEGEVIRYKQVISEFFEKVDANAYQDIIIDLRGNTGGSVNLLKYLLAYIQPNEEKEIIYEQLKNRNFWFGEVVREKTSRKQREPHFDGDVYIMTNGGSYSASVMFAVFAKKMVDATIIGEPAGGRPTGTSAGSFRNIRLKNSDIMVRIPETVFTYADKDEISIEPDVYVRPQLSDFFNHKADYQLETALEYISNGGKEN